MNKPLITDEVLALQYFGIFHSKILKMHLDKFEKLLDENPRLEYCLVKANAVLDRQEAARVILTFGQIRNFQIGSVGLGGIVLQ